MGVCVDVRVFMYKYYTRMEKSIEGYILDWVCWYRVEREKERIGERKEGGRERLRK